MDFDLNGDIRRDRIPQGPPVFSWANGIPFFTVYGRYYILGGDYVAERSWLLSSISVPIFHGCIAGPVIATSEAIPESSVCLSEQIHAFEVETRQSITWEAKTDLERTQNHFTKYIEDHSRLSLIFIGSDSFGFVSVSETRTYNVFLDPERTSIVNPMQVPSHIGNAKNARKRYVNDKNIKFKFPIYEHSLSANSNRQTSRKRSVPEVVIPETPLKMIIQSIIGTPKTPASRNIKRTRPEQTMPPTPRRSNRIRVNSKEQATPSKKSKTIRTPQISSKSLSQSKLSPTEQEIYQKLSKEFKIGTTCILLDDLRKIHTEITTDRQNLNTEFAKSSITLYKNQEEKYSRYRKIYRSIQKEIGPKDSIVAKLFRERIQSFSFPDDDEVFHDDRMNQVLTPLTPSITGSGSGTVGSSDVFPITPVSM